jgi:thiol-disulfide isomerase/thioredoxin
MRSFITSLVAACLFGVPALAAPAQSVELFETATWEQLQADLPKPSAVVFTATYCATCPAVLAKLAKALDAHDVKGDVVAVVIDEAEASELLASGHYSQASRVFLFSGNEAALRFMIDPRWHGETPYTALLPAEGKPIFTAGSPSEEKIATWLGR